jgi:hypothetical protein
LPRAGSSSTTSPPPRVRVPRLVGRLVVDYFVYAARPVSSATPRGTSRGSSCRSSSTTSPRAGSPSTTSPPPRVWVPRHVARLVTRLVVDYFVYATHLVASAHRVARRVTHLSARRRLLRLVQARRQLLRLCRASGCLGTSRGSSSTTPPRAGLSSTTSPTPRNRVPQHVARLVARLVALLVVDYFAYVARPGASARRVARHAAHRRLLRAPRLRLAVTLALLQPHHASRLLVSRQHWLTSSTPCAAMTSFSGRIASTIHLD